MMANVMKREAAWRNPWVWLLVGIMAAALIVNGVLITLAFMAPPSLVVNDYYEKGKDYFYDEAKEEKNAARLGWKLDLDLPKEPKLGGTESYLVRAVDRDGKPLEGGRAELAAFRPVQEGHDFSVKLRELGAGYYGSDVDFKLPGNWDLIVTVHKGEDSLDVAKRIFVKD
jgi:nitrogen fixation protein FixH